MFHASTSFVLFDSGSALKRLTKCASRGDRRGYTMACCGEHCLADHSYLDITQSLRLALQSLQKLGNVLSNPNAALPMRRDKTFPNFWRRSEEHTSELQSHLNLVCRLLLEKKKKHT